ncbi:hypothetical protein [Runella sp.]|uniref:hypothetical protein n=1 Tax=Runella sp. TaxID=1960881 RepID=UPI003019D273
MAEEKGLFSKIGGFIGAAAGAVAATGATIANTAVGLAQGKDWDTLNEEGNNIYENLIEGGTNIGEKAAPIVGTVITAVIGAVVTNEVNKSYKNDSDNKA